MKKLLTLATVVVMIFGLAAATYAVELRANGFIQNLTAWGINLNPQIPGVAGFPAPDDPFATTNTGFDDTFSFNYIWTHLDFTLEASEDLRGVIAFEAGPAIWGAYVDQGVIPGGVFAGWPDGYQSDYHATHGSWYPGYTANVYQSYVDFKVPGTDAFPTRMVVGLQPWFFTFPLAIGEYGTGVRLNTTAGPAAVSLFWRKHEENVVWQSDDFESYGLSFSMPAGPVTPSLWSIYYLMPSDATDVREPSPPPTAPALPAGVTTDGYHWYTGINVMGKAGIVDIVADFVYGMRKVNYNYPVFDPTGGWFNQPVVYNGEDTSGWVVRAKASVPVAMLTAGGDFMYATGGDNADWDNDREWSGYRYPIPTRRNMGVNVATIGDSGGLVYFKSFTNVFPGWGGQAGGDWYVRGFASVKPLDWLTVSFSGMYIGDNVENGNKYGDAEDLLGLPEDSDYAGIELDLGAIIKIYDNLSYEIGAGYLLAGDALDRYVTDLAGLPINESPKDPYAIISNLAYRF